MAQKLLKHELVERLLQLKEKQDLLTVQIQLLVQEISELAVPFMPKAQKPVCDYHSFNRTGIKEKSGYVVDVWGYRRAGITVSGATAIF